MTTAHRIELTRGRLAALFAMVVGLGGAVSGITVLVEHERHQFGEAHAGESKEKAGGHGGGEEEHAGDRLTLTPEMVANAGLELLTAGPGKVEVAVSLPGEVALNADTVAHVTPRVAGVIREVKRQLGDAVKKGDVLAVLDSRELADLQREASTSRERLALAEANLKRQEALRQENLTTEKDYVAAKQALAEARIEHRSATEKLALGSGGRSKEGGYALVAPVDGTIIERHATVGEVLDSNTRAFTVADLSTLWVNVTVYAKDLARVHAGQAASVRAEGIEQVARGTISYVSQVADEQTRSSIARVVLPSPGPAWRPGLFATADIVVDELDAAVTVSEEAVQRIDGNDVVFVQDGDGFEVRRIKIARRGAAASGRVVEVLSGVAAGERYAGRNSFVLKAELGKSEAAHEH